MAPPKRKSDQLEEEPTMRVTRAAAKRAAAKGSGNPSPAAKAPAKKKKAKKAKTVTGKRNEKKKEKEGAKEVESENEVEENEEAEAEASEKVADDSNNKTIVVEYCKQCNQFKKRAIMVKEGLENAGCGITVILNPEKPRRGCFEIRLEGGKKFITLLDMKRPFKPMRDLDMDKIIADIIEEMSN